MEPKNDPERRQHVPYILNGELYRIENQVGDNVTVKCCYCPPDRIYRGSVRSTGNFHMHIKRRHSSLLGKLHEMKVAALEERRDRIMKNRRFGKPRKKTPTPTPVTPTPSTSTAAQSSSGVFLEIPTPAGNESHELKIKTVFQRHKQEQEGATRRSGDSTSDNAVPANPPSISNSLGVLVQDLPNISVEGQPSGLTPSTAASVSYLGRPVKPEQQGGSPFLSDQPAAIDLSRAPSLQGESKSGGSLTSSMEDVSMEYSRSQSLSQSMSLTHFLDHPQRDVLQRLERTMAQISQELHCRNRIEHNRMLLEAAKFKFLNPNFQFEPTL
ncbi:protein stand still [Drosophila takahashii]|uniref:protein stand still n=1 Tax=Drosophila takahashii TaxID=29030 RepID=UPI001CF8E8A9|nr:protein stand still [Drosophila takahashii]